MYNIIPIGHDVLNNNVRNGHWETFNSIELNIHSSTFLPACKIVYKVSSVVCECAINKPYSWNGYQIKISFLTSDVCSECYFLITRCLFVVFSHFLPHEFQWLCTMERSDKVAYAHCGLRAHAYCGIVHRKLEQWIHFILISWTWKRFDLSCWAIMSRLLCNYIMVSNWHMQIVRDIIDQYCVLCTSVHRIYMWFYFLPLLNRCLNYILYMYLGSRRRRFLFYF